MWPSGLVQFHPYTMVWGWGWYRPVSPSWWSYTGIYRDWYAGVVCYWYHIIPVASPYCGVPALRGYRREGWACNIISLGGRQKYDLLVSKKVRPYNLSVSLGTVQMKGLSACRHGRMVWPIRSRTTRSQHAGPKQLIVRCNAIIIKVRKEIERRKK